MSAANIPSRLEPSGTYRRDGKKPDGITMVPWEYDKLLVWDVTCTNILAPSYQSKNTSEGGQWLLRMSLKRGSSIRIWILPTFSSQWRYRHHGHLVQNPCFFKELGHKVRGSTAWREEVISLLNPADSCCYPEREVHLCDGFTR